MGMLRMKILVVTVILLYSLNSSADQYSDALNKAAEAAYAQTGAKKMIEDYGAKLDKRYVPEIVHENGWIFAVVKAVSERKITFEVKF